MRNNTLKQWALAVLFLLMPWVADAAGLGRLSVLSSLGQPLKAEIDLVSVGKDELATLSTRLASPDAYKQANLEYGPALIGLRLAIEKRPNGEPYIKVTSTRSVNEPFIDLLVELNWAAGRITREYTALIDPPDYAPASATRPAPAPRAPAATAAPVERSEAAAPAKMGEKEYGPIKRGETLFKIANGMKPEGVTLEQMLVGLYRSNPDAFEKNMNRMKSGKILRVPEKEELAAVPQREAMKEYRTQVSDWNAYRRRLADAAAAAPESRSAASGKITTRVEEGAAAGEAKDVVRLSKGESPKGAGGKQGSAADRVRTLEEEAIAREKALSEANERVAQLEKNIKDMQRLLEIKNSGMAAVQQKAETKPETAAAGAPAPEAKKDEPKAAAPSGKPAAEAKAKAQPAPKAKPKVVPPPESGLVDTLLDEPLYLAAGGGVILLGLGLWMARRRRARAAPDDDEPVRLAPSFAGGVAKEPPKPAAEDRGGAAAVATAATATAATAAMDDASADEVDPLAEAEVYIAYGRDTQAEEILKEAIAKNPRREDVRLKLLEIYAARKDKAGFNDVAGSFHELTGEQGENWLKVAAMGYALDPGNPLYAAGKGASVAEPLAASPTTTDLDFDIGQSGNGLTSTDITLDPGMAQHDQMERTAMMDPGAMKAMANKAGKAEPEAEASAPLMPDFTLEIPKKESPSAAGPDVMDINIELPKIDVPEAGASGQQGHESDAGLDFKLDIGDINLNLDDQPKAGAAAAEGEKDAHWYDVQTKFDLAKAYQEMGDKEGAKEILQEVIREGDAKQQTEAKKLLETLS